MRSKISIALEESIILKMMGSLDPRVNRNRSELANAAAKRFLDKLGQSQDSFAQPKTQQTSIGRHCSLTNQTALTGLKGRPGTQTKPLKDT